MIKGEKVNLRAVELEDARIISAWLNDRETNKYLDVTYPLSKRYADSFVMEADEDKSKRVYIIDNHDYKSIGLVIIDKIKWEYRNCRIGISIYDKNHRGQGFGKDALKVAINFIFKDMNMNLVYLEVMESNVTAVKLYESIGFVREGVLRDRYFKNGSYENLIVMSMKNEVKI